MKKITLNKKLEGFEKRSPSRLNRTSKPQKKLIGTDVGNSEQPQKKASRLKKILKILGIFVLVSIIIAAITVAVLFYVRQQARGGANSPQVNSQGEVVEVCINILDPDCWTQAFKPELKQTNGKTTALIVGIDTRATGSGQGLANTDTIMLATVDNESGQTRLISFPRDLYAPYGCAGTNLPFRIKINAIYAWGRNNCEKDGMSTLIRTVEKITGETVNYHVLVRIEGVMKAIDDLGGITIDVPETFTDVFPYVELPEEYKQQCRRSRTLPAYCEFTFQAGPNNLSGEQALIYARMRQYSSDFVRARRQQQVVTAVKDKILGDDLSTTQKAQNLLSIYGNISESVVVSAFDLETVLASLALVDDVNTNPLQIVLDPQFGGGGLIFAGSGSNYNFRDYTFKEVQDKLKLIYANADIYRDQARTYAVNYTGRAWTNDNPVLKVRNSGLWFIDTVTDTKRREANQTALKGVQIIDYTNGEKKLTVDYWLEKFEGYNVEVIIADEENGLIPTTQYKEEIRINIFDLEPPVEVVEQDTTTTNAN